MNNTLLKLVFVFLLAICSSCSEDVKTLDTRIVGGEVISAHFLPYQVSVRRRTGNKSAFAHVCGGCILDANTILTAAHCTYNRAAEDYLIVVGTELRAGMDGGVVARVDKLVTHKLYNASITDNDIALIFVSPPLPVGTNFKVDKIEPAAEQPAVGTLATVSGWGATKEGGLSSNKLQRTQVSLLNSTDCQKSYNWRPITEAMLCAAVPGGGKDACQGDSGGPLVANNELIGIVSWGQGCARADYPGVYVNVSHFQSWIAEERAAFKKSN